MVGLPRPTLWLTMSSEDMGLGQDPPGASTFPLLCSPPEAIVLTTEGGVTAMLRDK
jgi:hypothetical protein